MSATAAKTAGGRGALSIPIPDLLPAQNRLIAELAEIPDLAARRGFLRKNRALFNPAAVGLLYEEVVRLARLDLRKADRLAQSAIWVADRLGDDFCRAQSLRAVGHVQLIKGKYTDALQSYQEALSLFRALGRENDVGRTLYGGSLQALIYLGQYDQAFAWALEARDIFQRLGDRLRLARLDSNMGNILYRQDRFEEALAYYQRALEGFGGQSATRDIAITLRNIAVCHISLMDFERALEAYAHARAHCLNNRMPLMVAEADYNIAYLYFQRGEYARAIALYQSTRKHCEELGDPYHKALCDLDQSEMYLELNLDEEGGQLASRAAATFQELGMRYEQAKATAFLAVASNQLGKCEQSLTLFKKARQLFRRERNHVWVALIDLYQALVLYQNGSPARARALCESALAFFSPSSLQTKAALSEMLLARLHLQRKELAKAHSACISALARCDKTEAPYLGYQAYFVLGQILEAQAEGGAARRAYLKAHKLLESLRSHLKGEELKISFLKDKLAVYESLFLMCLNAQRKGRKEDAFAFVEQAKSRSLADLIAFRGLGLPALAGPALELTKQAGALREELNWYYRQIESDETSVKPSPKRLDGLRQRMRGCEDQLVKVLSELRNADEHFGVLQNAGTVELDVIRKELPDGTMILEYYQARGSLYACVLGRHALEIVQLASADKIRALARLLQFQISKFRLGPDYLRIFAETLKAAVDAHLLDLHRELVAPVLKFLEAKHLVVIPHDFLHNLPFHAFHDGNRFLIDRLSISYAPSASVYKLCRSKPTLSRNQSLILGIPDSHTPHILEEVQNVSSMVPGPILFVGEEATEERLRRYGPESRIIHIATHGLFRQDNPMFSSMRLGDSQLSLLDLYSLNLSSELVTLSGCGTGLNAVVGGDELLGMVRGLLYAGTRAVLVTLWDVDDKSTADFMKCFYGHLTRIHDKALALREAINDVRRIYPHPYYWAPSVLVGMET
jgi:CHAT domain-containing protein